MSWKFFPPFRVLIQNFAAICDHLSSLEKKYGEETPSATPSTAPEPVYETKVAFDHFRFLVDFMNTHLEPSIRTYNQIQLGECSKITFPDLWMLFDPGSIVYSDHTRVRRRGKRSLDFDPWLTYNRMSRVLSAVGGGPLRRGLAQQIGGTKSLPLDDNVPHRDSVADKYSTLHLTCYIVEWNTTTWHACPVVFDFPPFEGEKDVTSFTVYPIHKSHPLRAQLKERGEKYIKLTTVSHWQYEGMTMGNGEGSEVFHASSQVVVDLKMAVQRGFLDFLDFTAEFDILTRSWLPPKGNEVMEMYRSGYTRTYIDEYGGEVRLPQDVYTDIQEKQFTQGFNTLTKFLDDIEKVKKRGDLNELIEVMQKDDNILLLPSTVSGYALRHRLWAKFDVDLLKPVSYNSGWDDLVLPKGHQELVQALVDAHPREDPQLFDVGSKRVDSNLLSKKGKGCVVLLHGPPGVGKTSTAECAAASTKRPLFHLTCGELGGRVTDVDRGLEDLFDLAHKWGCVLLLEEADVFLQKRGGDSLHRNALVSVFLRVMEHYSGILFVSVNRGVAIDDAFRSRVNLALSYPPLSKTQSKKVWNINIRRLEKQSEDRVKDGKPAITIQQDGILAFAAESYKTMRWNGRQIYNAFQTAFALADSKARRSEASELVVGKDEFRTVANSLTAFDACLAQTEDAANEDKGDDSESSDLEGDVISMRSNSGNDESG